MPSEHYAGRCGIGGEARMTGTAHTDMAAYVLGILDASDHAAFEEHLQGCPHCQLDLLELHDLPDLLAKVKKRWPGPPVPSSTDSQEMRPVPAPVRSAAAEGGQPLATLLDEAASSRRKQRSRSRILVAAAALLIVAGPLLTLTFTSGGQEPAAPLAAESTTLPEVHTGSAASPNDGINKAQSEIAHLDTINAKVSLTPKEWGTQADLELGGITGPLTCRLLAVTYGGESQVMTSWSVPVKGYGVPESPAPLRVSGGTALTATEIERFEVRTEDGSLLVTVDH